MEADPALAFNEDLTKKYITATEDDPLTHYVQKYSVLFYAGDVSEKSVLDLGSGTGIYCRAVKELGASTVVGVDISIPMLEFANNVEAKRPLGIQYRQGDGRTLGKIGEFDLVLANFVLIFMDSVENLEKFVRVIYENLSPSGRFIGIQFNCFSEEWFGKLAKYKRHAVKEKDIPNGNVVKFTCTAFDIDSLGVVQYYFDLLTYQEIFRKVGFRNFCICDPLLDEEGSKKLPEGYFQEYLQSKCCIVLIAEK